MSGREPSGGTKTQPTGAPPRPREPGLPTQALFSVRITIPRFVEEQVTEDVNDSRHGATLPEAIPVPCRVGNYKAPRARGSCHLGDLTLPLMARVLTGRFKDASRPPCEKDSPGSRRRV